MNITLFSLKEETAFDFIEFVEEEISFSWVPLNKEIELVENHPFSIFLLDILSANSSFLKEKVQQLIAAGVHSKSIYFVITNQEMISKRTDLEKVILELSNELSKYVVEPQIEVISLKTFQALELKNERFIYFDLYENKNRTIKEVLSGTEEDFEQIQNYIGKMRVKEYLAYWQEHKNILQMKNLQNNTLLTYKFPQSLIADLQNSFEVNIIQTNSEEEFGILSKDQKIISICFKEDMGRSLLRGDISIILNKQRTENHDLYFEESIFEIRNLPESHLKEMNDIIYFDNRGYPKPRITIIDWKKEVIERSGITEFKQRIGEVIK